MIALASGLIFMAAAIYLAYSPRHYNIALIFWLFAWGAMLSLYKLLGWDYNYNRYVVIYTDICVLAWAASNFGAEWLYTREYINEDHLRDTKLSVNPKHIFYFVAFCSAVGMIAPLAFIASSGIDVGQITNISGLFEVAESTHTMMAENRLEQDSVNKFTLMFALAGVIMVGIYAGLGNPGRKLPTWLKIAPIIPYFAMMMLTTVRTMMIVPMVFLLASWVSGLSATGREKSLFQRRLLGRVGLGVVLALMIIVAMQFVRASGSGGDPLETLDHLRLWFAGYEAALTTWITTVYDGSKAGGSATFRVIAGLLGAEDSKLAYGSGMVWVSSTVDGNAKTALASFIEDFGIYGAIIFCALFGAATGLIGAMLRNRHLALAPIMALLIGAAIWAPNSWFLGYGARLFAPLIPLAYIAIFWKVRADNGGRRQKVQLRVVPSA